MGFAVVILGLACTGGRLRRPPDAGGSAPVGGSESAGESLQSLYRIQYSGPEGSGGLRLVLRYVSAERFQLATADTLGRKLWTLDVESSDSLLIDHREEIFCRGGADLRIDEAALEMLPLVAIPRVLRGEMPVDLGKELAPEGSTELEDGEGRRWSVRVEGGRVVAWTLMTGSSPTLWWTRQEKGGILSHRDGSQFRWRLVVEESVDRALQTPDPPEGFLQKVCDDHDLPELRQDQSASPGSGTAE